MGPYYLWQVPIDISPTGVSVMPGLALVVLVTIAGCTSATTVGNFEKTILFLFTGPEGYVTWLGPHILQVERKR